MPIACMNAYTVVGPTNRHPRRFRSALMATDSAEVDASSSASYLFRAANVWTEIERAGLPDVQGVWMIPAGSSSLLTVVSVKQRYAGHAPDVSPAEVTARAEEERARRHWQLHDDPFNARSLD